MEFYDEKLQLCVVPRTFGYVNICNIECLKQIVQSKSVRTPFKCSNSGLVKIVIHIKSVLPHQKCIFKKWAQTIQILKKQFLAKLWYFNFLKCCQKEYSSQVSQKNGNISIEENQYLKKFSHSCGSDGVNFVFYLVLSFKGDLIIFYAPAWGIIFYNL